MTDISKPQGHASGDIVKTIPQVYIVEQKDGTFTVEAECSRFAGSYDEEMALSVAKQYIRDHRFIYPDNVEIKLKLIKEAR